MSPKSGTYSYLCAQNLSKMVTELLVVWVVGVVAFFALWAILLKVIQRISQRKHKDDMGREDSDSTETITEHN